MSLLFNHHNDDNNINTTTTITTTKTTTKPHNKYSKWSEKYTQIKHQRIQEQNEARKIMEEERRLYRPKFVERPKEEEYCHNAHEFVPYRYSWGARNETCMICDRFMHDNTVNTDDNGDMSMKSNIEEQKEEEYGIQSCELCPAVAHNSCIMNYERKNANDKTFSPPGNQKISSSSPSLHSKHHHWWCPDCSYEVSSYLQFQTSRHKMHQRKKLEFDSSLKLQASLMKLQEQNRYQKIRKGFLRLQAYARGVADRQGFMKDVATTHRVFRIKMGEFCDLWNAGSEGSRTNVSCISCVLNNNDSNEEEDYYDGDDDNQDDVENQLYRFETQTLQHGTSGRWNDTFMVYYSNSLVNLAFTVYERDESLLKSIFLGQAILDASNHLQIAFLCGKCQRIKIPLGPLQITPLEQGSKTTFRMDKIDFQGAGKISIEIHPFSNVDSKCGVLEEILSALLKGARKKWYAVLANRQLFLFSQFGDSRPKLVIPLHHGVKVDWHEKKFIKIVTMERTWFLTCPGAQQRNSWYTKIKGSYRETLFKGKQEFQAEYNKYSHHDDNNNNATTNDDIPI